MKALLRPATEADLRGIVQIERAAFADPWSEESFRRLLDGHSAIFQVAAAQPDSLVVGYVIAFSMGADAELLNIAVDPEHRLEGIAGQMLDALLATLAARGVGNVFLEVRESNVAARSLYRSRGFAEIGRRRNYYRRPVEGALVMRRLMDLAEGDEDQSAGSFADR
ncbi:MAG TPA: ribosomal protein S18-alanine N-acetyltransferase [Gemmatimonadaceae bacterium]